MGNADRRRFFLATMAILAVCNAWTPNWSWADDRPSQVILGANPDFGAYVGAIYRAEGGDKTRFPYGIVSVNTHGDKELARRICLKTVQHRYRQWVEQGKPGSFTAFLGRSYCPVGASNDPKGVNGNWVRNVDYWRVRIERERGTDA